MSTIYHKKIIPETIVYVSTNNLKCSSYKAVQFISRITDAFGLSSNETITIFITDENDVKPEFRGNNTVNVWEGRSVGKTSFLSLKYQISCVN